MGLCLYTMFCVCQAKTCYTTSLFAKSNINENMIVVVDVVVALILWLIQLVASSFAINSIVGLVGKTLYLSQHVSGTIKNPKQSSLFCKAQGQW